MASITKIIITPELRSDPLAREGMHFHINDADRICCPISRAELKEGSTCYKVDCCKYVFSKTFRQYLVSNSLCPMCRVTLNPESILSPLKNVQRKIKMLENGIKALDNDSLELTLEVIKYLTFQKQVLGKYGPESEELTLASKALRKIRRKVEKKSRKIKLIQTELIRLKAQEQILTRGETRDAGGAGIPIRSSGSHQDSLRLHSVLLEGMGNLVKLTETIHATRGAGVSEQDLYNECEVMFDGILSALPFNEEVKDKIKETALRGLTERRPPQQLILELLQAGISTILD